MRLTHSLLVGTLALGLASTASAQATKPQTSSKQTSTATTAKSTTTTSTTAKPKAAHAATVRASGKLSTFDAASKMLTLTNGKGSQQFTLTSSAKLTEGSKKIDMDALQKLTGRTVTVSYVEADGQKTIHRVRVSPGAKTTAKAAGKPSAAKKS